MELLVLWVCNLSKESNYAFYFYISDTQPNALVKWIHKELMKKGKTLEEMMILGLNIMKFQGQTSRQKEPSLELRNEVQV